MTDNTCRELQQKDVTFLFLVRTNQKTFRNQLQHRQLLHQVPRYAGRFLRYLFSVTCFQFAAAIDGLSTGHLTCSKVPSPTVISLSSYSPLLNGRRHASVPAIQRERSPSSFKSILFNSLSIGCQNFFSIFYSFVSVDMDKSQNQSLKPKQRKQ